MLMAAWSPGWPSKRTGKQGEQILVFGFWACFTCSSMICWVFLTTFAVSGCPYQVLSTDTFYSTFSCTRKEKCQLHHFFWPEKERFRFCGQRFWDNAMPRNALGGPFRTHLLHFFPSGVAFLPSLGGGVSVLSNTSVAGRQSPSHWASRPQFDS